MTQAKSHSWSGSEESRSKSPGVSWKTWLGTVKHGISHGEHPAEPARRVGPALAAAQQHDPDGPSGEHREEQEVLAGEGLEPLGQPAASSGLQHDERQRDAGVVRQREVHPLDARCSARARRRCRAARSDGQPLTSETTSASCQDEVAGGAERLRERLLGGEPGGQRLQRQLAPRRA